MKTLFNERRTAQTKVEIITGLDPIIYVDVNSLGKMRAYVDGCNDEIGWLGEVIKQGNDYLIKDVHLFKQQVHSTTCEITTEGLTDFANEILMQPNGIDTWNDMKLWGHSHVNMGVTPSGQDNTQMNVFKDCGHDFFVRVIANKKGEMEFTLYDYIKGLSYKDVKWVTYYDNAEIYDLQQQINALQAHMNTLKQPNIDTPSITQEIKDKVSKIRHATTYANAVAYNGYTSGAYDSWWDKAYGNKNTQQNKKKTNVTTNQISVVDSAESNDIYAGVGSIEDKILIAWMSMDVVALEGFLSVDDIFDVTTMTTVGVSNFISEEFGEEITFKTCDKFKELCIEYKKTYNEQYSCSGFINNK
ncbi:hypothetical protein [Romboutsia sp.]|uniref:hypothetical protein n=1 Tax=Romboutsia sp. TaxID=1965302 RepID=UPI002C11D344|nr:hypothetical protein [Romboutsia sp.]HSQ90200.1 hypothetical protein [Romboutsia sp.]